MQLFCQLLIFGTLFVKMIIQLNKDFEVYGCSSGARLAGEIIGTSIYYFSAFFVLVGAGTFTD